MDETGLIQLPDSIDYHDLSDTVQILFSDNMIVAQKGSTVRTERNEEKYLLNISSTRSTVLKMIKYL